MTKVKKNAQSITETTFTDISDVLRQPVSSTSQLLTEPEFEPENDTETVFEPEPEPEVITEVETITQEPEDSDEVFMSHADTASTIVESIDGLQSSVIPYLLENKTFKGEELEILDNLDKTGQTIYPAGSKEAILLVRWKRYQDVIAKIPFNTAEKRRLTLATANYVKTIDLKMTPMQTLLMAWSEVIIKRSTPFFKD
ncbi:MAG: hypothetical protein H7Y13_02390 [Sphingobacteriaceae bacterium]|nr:hypothetical protein [Sphingobacteriaceae bacterium]